MRRRATVRQVAGERASRGGWGIQPEDETDDRTRLHLVLLRDTEEHPRTARRADVVTELAHSRGVEVSSLLAEGSSAFQRIASLVHLADWATTYLALAEGVDPSPVRPIDELKDALRR